MNEAKQDSVDSHYLTGLKWAVAYKEDYGKKGWLKWIVIYLIVGAIAYFVVYYLFLRHTGTVPSTSNTPLNY